MSKSLRDNGTTNGKFCNIRNTFGNLARNQAWANPEKFYANPENTDNYFWKTFTNI